MNLFLPVYKRLEDDVIKLTESIFFADDQLNVYSLAIGDLLVRCVIEVEAISKELYLGLGGIEHPVDVNGNHRDLYFDTDCIKLLVDTWNIDKKKLQITNPSMYFSQSESILTPLHKAHKRGTSSSKWLQAYQAVKHYRTKSIKRATLGTLLNALGALYILNLYYADEPFWIETPIKDRREYTVDSKIFTPFVCDVTKISMSPEMSDKGIEYDSESTLEESIYLKKVTDVAYREIHDAMCKFDINVLLRIKLSDEYKVYVQSNPDAADFSTIEIARKLGKNYLTLMTQEAKILGNPFKRLSEKEVILCKNESIYPTLTMQSFLDSETGRNYALDAANRFLNKP